MSCTFARARCSGVARTLRPVRATRLAALVGELHARQWPLALLRRAAALAAEGDLLEARDLALARHARRVLGGQATDHVPDPVADLQREVRRRGAHELAHVIDRGLAGQPFGALVLAHRLGK